MMNRKTFSTVLATMLLSIGLGAMAQDKPPIKLLVG